MARTNSRRGFLKGGAVALAGASIPAAALAASEDAEVQASWLRWVELNRYDGELSDDDFRKMHEIEHEWRCGSPSLTKVAVLVLLALSLELGCLTDTIGQVRLYSSNNDTQIVAMLRHLRPFVGGPIGKAIADALDRPDEHLHDVLFGRNIGEA